MSGNNYGGWALPPAYPSAPPGGWVPLPPANPSAPPPYSDPQNLYAGGQPPQGAPVPYAQPPPPGVGYYPHPPYPGEQHSGYPPGYPPPFQLPMPHGEPQLYPDVSLLPQPQAGTVIRPTSLHGAPPHLVPPLYSHHTGYSDHPHQDGLYGMEPPPPYNLAPFAPPPNPYNASPPTSFYPPSASQHNLPDTAHPSLHPSIPYHHNHSRLEPNHNEAVLIGFSGASGPTPSAPAPAVPHRPAPPVPAAPGIAPAAPSMAPAAPGMAPAAPGMAPAPPGMAPAAPGMAPAFLGMAPGAHMPPTPPGSNENLALANLKEGEAPTGCVVSWRGGEGLQLFFLQVEGHLVSPTKKPLVMSVYKKIRNGEVSDGRLMGLVEVHGCWRLKLRGLNSFALRAANDTYVFHDDSTSPARVVVVQLPQEVSNTMRADLARLLGELVELKELGEDTVDKITTGVSTVYTGLTKKMNTAVKDTVPGAHKSTKWLRKGTGNLVRMGGTLVSKGMHFVADQLPAGDQQHQEESSAHTELTEALGRYRRHLEEGTITYA